MHRRLVPVLAVVLVTAGVLTACTAGSGGGSAGSGGAVDFQVADGRLPAAASAGGSSAPAAQDQSRSVVTTGRLALVADVPIAAADRVRRLVEDAGGRVGASAEDPSGRASARLELRIPAAGFEDVLAGIERQGEVRDVSVDSTDVTARATDYGVRIANLRTSIARLQGLLREADSSSALVTVERALTERQTSLEQLLAEQRTLADRVTYATLTVSIVTPAAAPAKGPGDFLAGVATGSDALARAAAATLVGLGVALPWLVVLAAAGAAGLLVRRTLRRRAAGA